jgi:hypothetical protein
MDGHRLGGLAVFFLLYQPFEPFHRRPRQSKATVTNPTEVPMLKTMLTIAALALAQAVQLPTAYAGAIGVITGGGPAGEGNIAAAKEEDCRHTTGHLFGALN